MSMTFWCPDASCKSVPCEFCADWLARGWIAEGERCDKFCTGSTEVSEAPEVNMSNTSAAGVLFLLGFQGDECECGSCDGATMRRLLLARNRDRSAFVAEPVLIPGGQAGTRVVEGEDGLATIQRMGPTFIQC